MRPFRFAAGAGLVGRADLLIRAGRRAEELGYSTLGMADHFMLPFAPLIALQAVADATTTLRLTQTVLDQDFRHPAVLAKELATLDVLSGGRLEVGIGAGWMRSEYERAGITFDRPTIRIERLEEVVAIVKGLFDEGPFSFSGRHFTVDGLEGTPRPVQRPRPPIMIGGGGPKLLAVAGRQADIVQLMPRIAGEGRPADVTELTAGAYHRKIGWIREAAGERFGEIELGAQLLAVTVTDDADGAYAQVVDRLSRMAQTPAEQLPLTREEILASPVVAVGSIEQVCDKLVEVRERFGLSYFACPVEAKPSALAPVIERLAGT